MRNQRRERKMTEKKSEQMMAKNLTNLVKNIYMHIQQVQQNPSRKYTKKFTHTHHSQTAESQCQRQNLESNRKE